MYSFIISTRPKSYNSKKSLAYENQLRVTYSANYPIHVPVETDLYGLVHHFFRRDIGIDADNLSKPVWDALRGLLFADDKQVKLRIAGSFNLSTNDFTTIDFSGLSGSMITSLLDALQEETDEHILYVECGKFTTDMIKLNLERNGN
ncbi:RusA family crossover junction endodeoxyribonuclease [Spirosoma spitsbergense]|uniref:RusA family crossover junction endodeoxyribonuclease n=1 Tax=Spirosoma spitsbergense TaxID=431554 RepID=UPI00037BADF8|nr:RusA family crossover junction endodeoxyribonuclease [Spirosoma spitsbergense]